MSSNSEVATGARKRVQFCLCSLKRQWHFTADGYRL